MNSNESLLSTSQVSERFGIPAATLRYWRHRNEGPQSFSIGKRVVYKLSDLNAWLAHQEATTSRGGVA